MNRIVKQVTLAVLGNFLGILIASLLLKNFQITGLGIFISVLIFSLAQIIFAPIVSKLTSKYAPSLSSLIALATTFLSLLMASIFAGGLQINGLTTWIAASIIVWILTVLLGVILPKFLFKAKTPVE